jgi:hypothetical protein
MPQRLAETVTADLDTMSAAIGAFCAAEQGVDWYWAPPDRAVDTTVAFTHLRAPERGGDRWLLVSQWLGPAAFFGDVRYSVRDVTGDTRITWSEAAEDESHVACTDAESGVLMPYHAADVARFARLIGDAAPVDPERWPAARRQYFAAEAERRLARMVTAYLSLQPRPDQSCPSPLLGVLEAAHR